MRKLIKVIIGLLVFIEIFTGSIFAQDLSYIEDSLINLGVNEEYSANIIEYLENIDISKSEFQKVESNINDIKVFIENSKSEGDVNFFKYYTVYDNIMDIAEVLNLGLDFNLNNLSITLIDKNNDNILYEGDKSSLIQIYSNYKDSNYNIKITEILQEFELYNKENSTENDIKNNIEIDYDNGISSNVYTEDKVKFNIDNKEKNNILDEYIDKFEDYNENLLVNNNGIVDWTIVLIIFGIALAIFVVFKIVSRFKRLQ